MRTKLPSRSRQLMTVAIAVAGGAAIVATAAVTAPVAHADASGPEQVISGTFDRALAWVASFIADQS